MATLSINNFSQDEINELEKKLENVNFDNKNDSLRMWLSLKVMNVIGKDSYKIHSKYIQEKIDIIYNNLASILK